MSKTLKVVLPVAVLAAVGAGAWWALRDRGPARLAGAVERPAVVRAWAGVRAPQPLWDRAAALLASAGVGGLAAGGLPDLLAASSGLSADVIAEVALDRPLWAIAIDARATGRTGADPIVWVIPLRDGGRFLAALRKTASLRDQDGMLRVETRVAGGAVQGVSLRIDGGHALVGDGASTIESVGRYAVAGLAAGAPPAHDVEIHMPIAAGDLSDPRLDATLATASQRLGPVLAGALRRALAALRGADEATVALDVSDQALAASLRARPRAGQDGKVLRDLIARQQQGAPYGLGWLPQDAWLVYSDRFPAAARADVALDLQGWNVQPLLEALSGEVSIAAHAPPEGSGVALSAVAHAPDAGAALAALDGIAARLAGSPPRQEQGLRMTEVGYRVVPQARDLVRALLGDPVPVAYGADADRVFLAAGPGARAAAEAMRGAGRSPSLADNALFARSAGQGAGRAGRLYLWPTGLMRLVPVAFAEPLRSAFGAVAAALPEGDGLQIDWGVDETRAAIDVTARVPAGAFTPFAALARLGALGAHGLGGGLPGGGLPGGGVPGGLPGHGAPGGALPGHGAPGGGVPGAAPGGGPPAGPQFRLQDP